MYSKKIISLLHNLTSKEQKISPVRVEKRSILQRAQQFIHENELEIREFDSAKLQAKNMVDLFNDYSLAYGKDIATLAITYLLLDFDIDEMKQNLFQLAKQLDQLHLEIEKGVDKVLSITKPFDKEDLLLELSYDMHRAAFRDSAYRYFVRDEFYEGMLQSCISKSILFSLTAYRFGWDVEYINEYQNDVNQSLHMHLSVKTGNDNRVAVDLTKSRHRFRSIFFDAMDVQEIILPISFFESGQMSEVDIAPSYHYLSKGIIDSSINGFRQHDAGCHIAEGLSSNVMLLFSEVLNNHQSTLHKNHYSYSQINPLLRQAIDICPDNVQLYINLADNYAVIGEHHSSIGNKEGSAGFFNLAKKIYLDALKLLYQTDCDAHSILHEIIKEVKLKLSKLN